MSRVVLFGGTFNPPHLGHVAASRTASNALKPCTMIWLPSREPPHKTLPPGSPTPAQRLAMCALAAQGLPDTQISDFELLGDTRYTVDTVRGLAPLLGGAELWLLIGGDMLLSLHEWAEAEKLLSLVRIAALCRRGGEQEALRRQAGKLRRRYGASIRLLRHDAVEVSSTGLRDMLQEGRGAEYLPPPVYRYILENQLYL